MSNNVTIPTIGGIWSGPTTGSTYISGPGSPWVTPPWAPSTIPPKYPTLNPMAMSIDELEELLQNMKAQMAMFREPWEEWLEWDLLV